MPIAIDKQSGAAVFLDQDGQWKPAQMAQHPETGQRLAWDGSGWQPIGAPQRSLGQLAEDTGRALAQGATAGWADELAAGADTLFGTGAGKPTYEENLAAQKARTAQIPAQVRIPGETAGAMLGGAALTAPAKVGAALEAIPAWLRYPGMGAATGALFGAGQAEPGLENRLYGAAQGAATGLAAGSVLPPFMAGGREAVNYFRPGANAQADLAKALARDNDTVAALQARHQGLLADRPNATIADVAGPNTRDLLERIAQTPGAGLTVVAPAMEQKQKGALARISNDLRSLTGTKQTAAEAINDTIVARQTAANPLYDKAFNFNATQVPEITRAWQQETSTGYGRAFLLNPNFRRTLQTEYGIADPANAPLMVQIDAWKKVADDFVRDNIGTNRARVVQNMRNKMLDVVDYYNPDYAAARSAWAGPADYLESIDEGRKIFETKIEGDQLGKALGAMGTSQREGYTIGAISAIVSKMRHDPAEFPNFAKYLRSPEMRDKVAALMPDDAAREAWTRRLNYEIQSAQLFNRTLGGSQTARRTAQREDAQNLFGEMIGMAFNGQPPMQLWRRLTGLPQDVRDKVRRQADELVARGLTGQDLGALSGVQPRAAGAGIPLRAGAIAGGVELGTPER